MQTFNNFSPSNLRRKIEYINDFSIVESKGLDGKNYTFFVWTLKEKEPLGFHVPDSYLFIFNIYKEGKFIGNYMNNCFGYYAESICSLLDEIVKLGTNIIFSNANEEILEKLPCNDEIEDSLFGLHLLFNLDFSFYDFDSSNKKLDKHLE